MAGRGLACGAVWRRGAQLLDRRVASLGRAAAFRAAGGSAVTASQHGWRRSMHSDKPRIHRRLRRDTVAAVDESNLREVDYNVSVHRSSLNEDSLAWELDAESYTRHATDMELMLLGTGSKLPMYHRGVSAYSLMYNNYSFLVDCGEGTQVRMQLAKRSMARVSHIYITHMHGDHIFGLPGVILNCLQTPELARLEVVGPPGLRQWLDQTFKACAVASMLKYTVKELHSSRQTLRHRMDLLPDKHGVWHLLDDGQFTVKASAILHNVPTWGYAFSEKFKAAALEPAKAIALGVTPGADFGKLKRGQDVTLSDGTVIKSSQVMGQAYKGRKIVVLGDTCDASGMWDLSKDADVVVHECTMADDDQKKAVKRGHSTPTIAAHFARKTNAKHLVLSHYSQRFSSDDHIEEFIAAPTRKHLENTETEVTAGSDLMRLVVHRVLRETGESVVPAEEQEELAAHEARQADRWCKVHEDV